MCVECWFACLFVGKSVHRKLLVLVNPASVLGVLHRCWVYCITGIGEGADVLARDCMHSASAATPIIISNSSSGSSEVPPKYLCTLLMSQTHCQLAWHQRLIAN